MIIAVVSNKHVLDFVNPSHACGEGYGTCLCVYPQTCSKVSLTGKRCNSEC